MTVIAERAGMALSLIINPYMYGVGIHNDIM